MKNREVAKLLGLFADYSFDEPFKERAFRKASLDVDSLKEDIEIVWKEGRLKEIPGIGEGISKKIDDFLANGKSKYLDELRKKTPVDIEELTKISGIGPKKIQKLYNELGIKNIADLKKAAEGKKLSSIEGFGELSEKNILKSISANPGAKRFSLEAAKKEANFIIKKLKSCKEVSRICAAGSIRRMKETIGDIDILAASKNPKKVMDIFISIPSVKRVLAKGETKSSVILKSKIQADLRVVDEKIFGAALLYFTGSKEHNIALRNIAISKGLKLSEYGLFDRKTGKLIAAKTEEEIYKKLGLEYIGPELRENGVETLLKKLPKT